MRAERADGVRDGLVAELERCVMDEEVKEVLVEGLEGDGEGVVPKRKRGRPRKNPLPEEEEDERYFRAEVGDKVVKEQERERERKMDRLDPQATKEERERQGYKIALREAGWAISDLPGGDGELDGMTKDLKILGREAGYGRMNGKLDVYDVYFAKLEEFKDLKKKAAGLLKVGSKEIEEGDLKKLGVLIGDLKGVPVEIEKKYKEIREVYEVVCEELMDKASKGKREKGVRRPDAMYVEKGGFGMMEGESLEGYRKRMKALKRGKEVPKTIGKIDEIVEQTERRWRSVAGIGIEEFVAIKANWQKTVEGVMSRSAIASNVRMAELNEILREGMMGRREEEKETDLSVRVLGDGLEAARDEFSEKCFGVGKELGDEEREKYGCLHLRMPSEEDCEIGGQYGWNVIRWKPSEVVATMVCADSLYLATEGLNYMNPSLLTDPSPCSFSPERKRVIGELRKGSMNVGLKTLCAMLGIPYVELQMHGNGGQYGAKAIESISFRSEEDVKNLSIVGLMTIISKGIEVYVGGERVKLGVGWTIEKLDEEEWEEGEDKGDEETPDDAKRAPAGEKTRSGKGIVE